MGSKYRVKRIFKPLVIWIAKQFQKIHITPNQVSTLGTFLAISAGIVFYLVPNYCGSISFGLLVFFTGIMDGVDGTLARLTNSVSVMGGYFDSVLDRYADTFIILSFLGHYSHTLSLFKLPLILWVILAIMGVIMVSYIRTKAEESGIEDCDVGLGARSERLFVLVVSALVNYATIGLVIVVFLSHLTAIYRINYVRKNNRSRRNEI
ncbi:MAG: CDP-alcohol phosphatidyltransferase family protein [Candidatus Helarchaeota archaeon]